MGGATTSIELTRREGFEKRERAGGEGQEDSSRVSDGAQSEMPTSSRAERTNEYELCWRGCFEIPR